MMMASSLSKKPSVYPTVQEALERTLTHRPILAFAAGRAARRRHQATTLLLFSRLSSNYCGHPDEVRPPSRAASTAILDRREGRPQFFTIRAPVNVRRTVDFSLLRNSLNRQRDVSAKRTGC